MENQLPPAVTKIVKESGDVKIHTFVAPESFISNATHVIETKNQCIVIDGQFVVPYALQFREYVDAIGKPISRVYLSHGHPDHFFGIGAAFADCEIYALQETIDFIKVAGESIRDELAKGYGDFVTKTIAVPQNVITAGEETIDGLKLEHVLHKDTETEFHLSIKLPELDTYIVQDLVYSGAHIYLTKDIPHWVEILESIRDSEFSLFLPGHGEPADKKELQSNIEYLNFANSLLNAGTTAEALKAALLEKYPHLTGAGIFDIYLPRLFA